MSIQNILGLKLLIALGLSSCMDALGRYIDNVEGVCFGSILPNGHQSLIFVTDNNFDKEQKTQFLLFEVMTAS